MFSSETGISSCMPNIIHLFKILTATWFRKSHGDIGLVNTVLFGFARLSGSCGGKDPVWLVQYPSVIHSCFYDTSKLIVEGHIGIA